MSSRAVIDVSRLPPSVVDTRGLLWWGNSLMLVIEGTVLALLTAVYFYLRFWLPVWPPAGATMPSLVWPTLNLLVLIVSAFPMHHADKAAHEGDRAGVQMGLLGGIVLSAVFMAGRWQIWRAFHFDYASHAYGSIVFAILVTHTGHVLAATVEAVVLLYFASDPDTFHDEQRLGVRTSGLYWNFIVGTWIVLYAVLYFGPRVL